MHLTQDREAHILLKKKLANVWFVFFARYGGKLTEIQLKAIPKIISGSNVVIASPTASGKTEAVLAPVLNKLIDEKWEPISILYLVPTRALANDVFERIDAYSRDLGLSVTLKHGDVPVFNEDELTDILITTPESLDSLLCRHYKSLCGIRTVIVDELHLLDNTYRGDQLRCLLRRLEKATQSEIAVHALSATLSDPEESAKRYMKEFDLVVHSASREINYTLIKSYEEIVEYVRKNSIKKVLCFSNSRASTEKYADLMQKLLPTFPVVFHHAGLSKKQRMEAEQVMKQNPCAICVSTSTLELGIDIGNIDLTILMQPPWSISSLLQRIGRGNRREKFTRVLAVYNEEAQKLIYENMFLAAMSGNLPCDPYIADLSVIVQQVMSLLFQYPQGYPEKDMYEILGVLTGQNNVKKIVTSMIKKNWIEQKYGRFYASRYIMDLGEKGQIHSNISSNNNVPLVDLTTGNQIGFVEEDIDKIFIFNDKYWQIESFRNGCIEVTPFLGDISIQQFKKYKYKGRFSANVPPDLE